MFSGASTFVESVDTAFLVVLGLSVLVFLGIVASTVYFIIRYSRRRNPHPTNIEGNLWLEITWTVIPLVLFLGMFYLGWAGYKEMRSVPADAITVTATGRMWQWTFEYPNGVQTDTLYAVVNAPIRLNLVSADVNHSLFIPAFRIKKDVLPGRKNVMWFKSMHTGSYDIACAEYCGLRHAYMYTKVVVQDSSTFEHWYRAVSQKQGKKFESLLVKAVPPLPAAEEL